MAATDFVMIWRTTAPDESITLGAVGSGFNALIDWGDGQQDTITSSTDPALTHIYANSGDHTVTISGAYPWFYNNFSGNGQKLIDITQWGDVGFTSMERAFAGCSNLVCTATDGEAVSITSMQEAFQGCSSFNGNISKFNLGSCDSLFKTFQDCTSFNQPLNGWNTSNITDLRDCFRGCSVFNQPLDQWDASSFQFCTFTFFGCGQFNGDVSTWTMTSAVNCNALFRSCSNFNSDISNWQFGVVTNISEMLDGANTFDHSLGNWDVSNVTNADNLFSTSGGLSTANYNDTLIKWSQQNLKSGISTRFGTSKHCGNGTTARQSIIDTYNWTITDGGTDPVEPCPDGPSEVKHNPLFFGQDF